MESMKHTFTSAMLLFISLIHVVNCSGIQSLLLNSGRSVNTIQSIPVVINITANRQIIDLTRREIAEHLLRNGGRGSDFDKPSTLFMMKVFEDLLDGKPLQEAVGHQDQMARPQILISDTLRSFSAKRLRSSGRFTLRIPILPRHEHLKMAELRIPADENFMGLQKFIISVQTGNGVTMKFRVTHRFKNAKESFIYSLTSYLYANTNRVSGKITIVIKRKTDKNQNKDRHTSGDMKKVPIVVLYSQDKKFLETVYTSYTEDEKDNDIRDVMTIKSRTKRAASRTRKGRKRRKWRKNEICQLHNFSVDFDLIGWGPWIVHPKRFNAKVCYGQCPSPVGHEYSPTNHAMLQTLMRMKRPRVAPEPCCVPTKLQPLSMLYFEYDDIVVRHHQDMVAGECGCR